MSKNSKKVLSEKDLRKKYRKSNQADIVIPNERDIRIPSSCLALNYGLGGGLQYGRILELYGQESVGKSLLAFDFARSTQSLGGKVIWADIENVWSNEWASNLGINVSDVELLSFETSIEYFADWSKDMSLYYRSELTQNEPILLVLDSLAALELFDVKEGYESDNKADMGKRAKAIGEMWRRRQELFASLGVTVIAINQLRQKTGFVMGSNETTTSGNATKFYASYRVNLRKRSKIKGFFNEKKGVWEDNKNSKNSIIVGNDVKFRFDKNKVGPPVDDLEGSVYFKPHKSGYRGIDKDQYLLEILELENLIEKKGHSIYLGDKKIARGKDHFYEVISTDKEIRKAVIDASQINTLSKTRKELEQRRGVNYFSLDEAEAIIKEVEEEE